MPERVRPWVFLAVIGALGCEGSGGPSVLSVAEVRDSAGITVVENHPGEAPLRYIASLDSSYLRLGVLDGDPAYIFSSIVGLRVLDDGGVLVAEGQAKEIRVYDASGLHVRTFGGEGDGPGEFAALSDLVDVSGDTVWVWDDQNARLTSFLTSGELLGTNAAPRADPTDLFGRIGELHRLGDGTYVAETSWISGLRDIPTESSERSLVRDSIVLRYLDAALQEVDTIAILPGSESLREINVRMSGGSLVGISMRGMARPFGRTSYYHPRLQGVVTATNDSFEWMVRALDGTVQLISRVPEFNQPISAGQATELRESLMSMDPSPERTREVEGFFEDFPLPDLAPAFGAVHVDPRGRVWLAEYQAVTNEPYDWIVFSPDGHLLGRVEVPEGFQLAEIGDDYVLGIQRDEFDVPYVLRFRLVEI